MAPGCIKSFNFKNNYRLTVDHLIRNGLKCREGRRGLFCAESFTVNWQEILMYENVYQIKVSKRNQITLNILCYMLASIFMSTLSKNKQNRMQVDNATV